MITQNELKELLYYEPETGIFTWYASRGGPRKAKNIAGNINHGYIEMCVKRERYLAHRLAFLYMKGYIPTEVDHIDNNPGNNCWKNLRETTHRNNQRNRNKCKSTASGYKGVRWHKNRWNAYVGLDGKFLHLGTFTTKEEAAIAYNNAAIKYFGEYARLNEVVI